MTRAKEEIYKIVLGALIAALLAASNVFLVMLRSDFSDLKTELANQRKEFNEFKSEVQRGYVMKDDLINWNRRNTQ